MLNVSFKFFGTMKNVPVKSMLGHVQYSDLYLKGQGHSYRLKFMVM